MNLAVANWKMNKTRAEALAFRDAFSRRAAALSGVEIAIAPAFPFLAEAADPGGRWALSGQDCSGEKGGAFTGEVSSAMLASCGCRYVILGHSERRLRFGENTPLLSRKLARAREAGLTPVFCVGETLAEREAGATLDVLAAQLSALAEDPGGEALAVAYEPVWAIGTGCNAAPEQAEEAMRSIRRALAARTGGLRLLYGGSVTPDNAAALAAQPSVNGFLVGGASLDPESFSRICLAAAA